MPRSFLDPPLMRLGADGRARPAAEGAAWRRPIVLVARELCSFEWFEPAGGVRPSAQAARLYARANAPFLQPGVLVRAAGGGWGIWWWDAERIAPALAAEFGAADVAAAPETLAQPPGAGWRVVRLESGFELQCWRGRALIASSWRREAPAASDWAAFARQVRDPPEPAPAAPPAAETLPIARDLNLGAGGAELTPASAARLAASATAAALAIAAAFWVGQGLRLGAVADRLEREAHAEQAAVHPSADDTALRQRLAALHAFADRPDPLAGLGAALGVLKSHGVVAKSFTIDGPVVTVTAPYTALGQIDAITAALEATGQFGDIRPLPDSASGDIRIELTLRGATRPVAAR
jgi:hypothetical protein